MSRPTPDLPRGTGHVFAMLLAGLATSGLLLSACDRAEEEQREGAGEGAPPPPLVVRDSSGVEIVDAHAPRWGEGEGWIVDQEPALQIGVVEGDSPYQFHRVHGATRLPDGRLIVVEAGPPEIRLFDPSGHHLRTIGREGSGPGEFEAPPDLVLLPGDTLLAFDVRTFRYSWFTLDGDLLREETVPQEAVLESLGIAVPGERILLPDGSLVLVSLLDPSNVDPFESGGIVAYRPIPDELARHGIRISFVSYLGRERVVLGEFPFRESGFVPGGSAHPFFEVANEYHPPAHPALGRDPIRIHVTTPGRREIRSFDERGDLRRILRQHVPLEPLDQARIRASRDRLRQRATRGDVDVDLRRVTALFDRIAFPDSVFPYSGLEVDARENLWVMEHRRPPEDGARIYQVFEPSGAWLGAVSVPGDVDVVHEIGADHLVATRTDEHGVPFVGVYRVRRDRRGVGGG